MVIKNVITNQTLLENCVTQLFVGEKILSNVKKETKITNPLSAGTNNYLEVDIWVPDKQLCFEFQDLYHFENVWYSPLSQKYESLRNKRETVIVIPFWWSGDVESLAAEIKFHRPDLLDYVNVPFIPLNPPSSFLQPSFIPGVGELMLASFSQVIPSFSNPWWLGEKYDGIRFCWNHYTSNVYRRSGLALDLPPKLLQLFPDLTLDGEIWFGRGQFYDTISVINNTVDDINWSLFRAVAFDNAEVEYHHVPFEDRYSTLFYGTQSTHPFLIIAPRIQSTGQFKILDMMQEIIKDGGEGVIMRKKGSLYIPGRSDSLIKIKTAQADAEALVVRSNKNFTKLQMPGGMQFNVSSNDFPNLKEGDIVQFEYDRYAQQSYPVNPHFVKIRKDISWDDVIFQFEGDQQSTVETRKSSGHWKDKNFGNSRQVFELYARNNHFDPLLEENWYSVSSSQLINQKGAKSVLHNYGGSLSSALIDLFPELNFDKSKFSTVYKNYWSMDNRRNFFLNFAKLHNFDPFVPENWYQVSQKDISSSKRGWSILTHHGGSHISALVELFPEIGLVKSHFNYHFWKDGSKRREFFEKFADRKGFDFLNPESWYSVKYNDLISFSGGKYVISMYSGNLATALISLFPEVNFDRSKFLCNHWQKLFFTKFAKLKGFDPLVAANWYNVTKKDILSFKRGDVALNYYNGSLILALTNVFPNIGLEKVKLISKLPNKYWANEANRRLFYIQFAAAKKFDPLNPNNWYQISRKDIVVAKGGPLLEYHGGSFVKSLLDLFPNIGLENSKFISHYWDNHENQREFFKRFAKLNNFDYTRPKNWLQYKTSDLITLKGGKSILKRYKSLSHAFSILFPNIMISDEIFDERKWENKNERRKFLENFAETEKFNPSIPENWYTLTSSKILATKNGDKVLSHYNGSLVKALVDLFPELNFEINSFSNLPKNYWKDAKHRREFFEIFAKENHFDPLIPNNWQNIKNSDINAHKSGGSVLTYHGGSVKRAILSLFPELKTK